MATQRTTITPTTTTTVHQGQNHLSRYNISVGQNAICRRVISFYIQKKCRYIGLQWFCLVLQTKRCVHLIFGVFLIFYLSLCRCHFFLFFAAKHFCYACHTYNDHFHSIVVCVCGKNNTVEPFSRTHRFPYRSQPVHMRNITHSAAQKRIPHCAKCQFCALFSLVHVMSNLIIRLGLSELWLFAFGLVCDVVFASQGSLVLGSAGRRPECRLFVMCWHSVITLLGHRYIGHLGSSSHSGQSMMRPALIAATTTFQHIT